ncbi:MAG: enoyl-CoA hydratase/isomerase family protein [Candidatus Geothermincolia bacterium]
MNLPKLETIAIEFDRGVATLVLDRPEKLNAMNQTMFAELGTAADFVRDDDEVKVAVITGRGRAFCAGIDLASITDFKDATVTEFRTMVRRVQRNFRAFELIEKPVIAMVNGHCLGAGLEIALASDMILASSDATFGLLEVNIGLVVDLGGSQRLPRYIGIHRAKELVLTGKKIDVEEADRIGLINAWYPPEELQKATRELADHLMTLSPVAVGLCKINLDRCKGVSTEAGLEYEAQAQSICFGYLMDKLKQAGEKE